MNAGNITNAVIALATLITAITALIKVFRTDGKVEEVKATTADTLKVVNGKNDNLVNRTVQLEQTLTANKLAVPPDPNIAINQEK